MQRVVNMSTLCTHRTKHMFRALHLKDKMKIKENDFNVIVSKYEFLRQRFGTDFRSVVKCLVQMFDRMIEISGKQIDNELKESLIYSLVSNEYKSELRSVIPRIDWNSVFNLYFKDNTNQKSLFTLAEDNRLSYGIASQHILQFYLNWDKSVAKRLSANTSLINNGRLAFDVMECNINDIIYGNHSNHMTNNSGITFELEISHYLKNHRISYLTEHQLRADSYDVTPDFKLNLPIVLKISGKADNRQIFFVKSSDYMNKKCVQLNQQMDEQMDDYQNVVITWIECKSLFASVSTHSQYYRNQYSSYVNRFGNGLVLYKFGFVSDLPQELKRNIIISDEFPKLFQPIL